MVQTLSSWVDKCINNACPACPVHICHPVYAYSQPAPIFISGHLLPKGYMYIGLTVKAPGLCGYVNLHKNRQEFAECVNTQFQLS